MDSQHVFLMPQTPANVTQTKHLSSATQVVPQCAICGTAQKLLRCAKCKTVYYCSTDHQHADWPSHKKECRTLAKQRNNNNRLQQLTNGCSAINISSPIAQATPATIKKTQWENAKQQSGKDQIIDNRRMQQPVLGTHENEILQSKAQVIKNNTNNSEYINNFDANSTTIDQIHIIENGTNPFIVETNLCTNNPLFNEEYSYQQQQQQQCQLQTSLANCPSDPYGNQVHHNNTLLDNNKQQSAPESSQGQELDQQKSLQYPVPQLSNYLINQHEKSSSYQIGTSILAESIFEDIK